ncbi:hypothetical protein B0H16DRAFT_1885596 [Mycena metata]|uniref:F-box domain-containing protein n=1 Tax=Mycena metata TaxID=1033252 RepID=A0AAD7J652_9AGAR|nr:hypothetical protein B0H16DRAFT_1885596 [Mycena metata]
MLSTNIDLRTRLAELDGSITELKLRLKVLEDARVPIQRQLDDIIYPVLTLPPEILSDIFIRCLSAPPPAFDDCKTYAPNTKLAPLLLLQVCRTWRDIALSTPFLWSSLHLGPKEVRGAKIDKIVADWFDRAGSCPLTFNFPLHLKGYWELASAVLRGLAPRIQTLCLQHLKEPLLKDLTAIGPFPILESLAISYRDPLRPSAIPVELFIAPRLRHISLSRYALPRMFVIPQGVYTVTCGAPITVDESLDLIQGHPFLKELSCTIHSHTTSRTEIVTHNHLEALRPLADCSLLRLLRLPALQNLHLDSDITYWSEHFPTFLASTSLRRFRADRPIKSLSVEWFAAAMPGLVDLELCNPGPQFLRKFFGMLNRTRESAFLPHLRTLMFRASLFELDASVLGALSSRCTAGDENLAVLESFQQIWDPISASLADTLSFSRDNAMSLSACRELVERGMAVHVGPEGQNLV